MGQAFSYVHERYWIVEGSIWRPPTTMTLRDEAGLPIGNSQMATMVMTLYDLSTTAQAIVNSVDHVDIKNTRSCTLSSTGVLIVTLLPSDTAIVDSTHAYELRRVLIEYTWPMIPTKADAIELTVVIRNLARRPFTLP